MRHIRYNPDDTGTMSPPARNRRYETVLHQCLARPEIVHVWRLGAFSRPAERLQHPLLGPGRVAVGLTSRLLLEWLRQHLAQCLEGREVGAVDCGAYDELDTMVAWNVHRIDGPHARGA